MQAQMIGLKDTSNNTIGKMPVIPGLRRDIFLRNFNRSKESSGLFVTEYTFIQPNHLEAKNVILIFQLDKKFENVYYTIQGDSSNSKVIIAGDKYSTSVQVPCLPVDSSIVVKFTSKKTIIPTITGIGGQLDFKLNK